MWRRHGMLWPAVLAMGVLGCGKSEGPPSKAAARPAAGSQATTTQSSTQPAADGPAAAVGQFLDAVRTGDDQQTNRMLSATARSKLAQLGGGLTPPASDTARFEVGKVELVGPDGARVACSWTDLDDDGKPASRHMLWVVRHEIEGWRVVGVAWTVFEGEPPLLLNFENPEDVLKKQEWLRTEVARRSGAEKIRKKAEETPGDAIRR